jgi:hypothetical protein
MTTPPPMYAPPPTEGPKKTPVWVWILAAVGGMILLGVIAISLLTYYAVRTVQQVATNPAAAAAILSKIDPNLEVLDVDEDKKIIRVRNKRNNEETILNLNDIMSGRLKISHEGRDGTETVEIGGKVNLPGWLPKYPGVDVKGIGAMSSDKEGAGGMFTFETPDSAEKIHAFYREGLEKQGFKVDQNTEGHVVGAAVLKMKSDDDGGAMVTVTPGGAGSQVTVFYGRK